MGPTTYNGPTRHPGGERIRLYQHSAIPATINPPLPQCAQRNRATIGLCPDLHRAQYLPPNFLLPIPPPGPHIGNTRPGCSHRANILSSPLSVTVKAPRVADASLSLRAYKRARDWFRRWYFHHLNSSKNLPPPHNKTTQSSQDS